MAGGEPVVNIKRYAISGLDCANCAANIEQALNDKGYFGKVRLNFASGTIALDAGRVRDAQKIISGIEPGVVIDHEGKTGSVDRDTRKRMVFRGAVFLCALVLFIIGIAFKEYLHNTPHALLEYVIFLTAYLLVGWKVVYTALRNILKGRLFDENFLMTLATTGAIVLHELPEAVAVMLFYFAGEFLQDLAVNRSRRSIASLMDIKPESATLKTGGGLLVVTPESLSVGDQIVVKAGEKIPVDGVITEGDASLDTSALTGESAPRSAAPGDGVLGGMVNTDGLLTITVSRTYEDSSVAKILELVENAASRKAPTEKFISRFSKFYTPIVVLAAAAFAFIPPIFIKDALLGDWVYRALILLVISCPCALVISIPLGYFGGIGAASKRGILVKGANFLEAFTKVRTVVLDKTGTITEGLFHVSEIEEEYGFTKEELLRYAAIAESGSNHPIAVSIVDAFQGDIDHSSLRAFEEIPGHGVKSEFEGKTIYAGNDRLLHREDIPHDRCTSDSTVVYVAVDRVLAGTIKVSDKIKPDTVTALQKIKEAGVEQIVMLTGDEESVAARVAKQTGLDTYYANLLPEQKVAKVEELMASSSDGNRKLLFAGDGINDAPVIARADIGVAMGAMGSDASIEAADVVLMDDNLTKIATAIEIGKQTKVIVWQNIVFALAIKAAFIALGLLGTATMWQAVIADVGVALLAVLNATRILAVRKGPLFPRHT